MTRFTVVTEILSIYRYGHVHRSIVHWQWDQVCQLSVLSFKWTMRGCPISSGNIWHAKQRLNFGPTSSSTIHWRGNANVDTVWRNVAFSKTRKTIHGRLAGTLDFLDTNGVMTTSPFALTRNKEDVSSFDRVIQVTGLNDLKVDLNCHSRRAKHISSFTDVITVRILTDMSASRQCSRS